jgi:hypothetical protein
MIYFIKGCDEEINLLLNDLKQATAERFECMDVCLNKANISNTLGHVVCEISDVQRCINAGVSPNRIIGIGYSKSSYHNNPITEGLCRHYVTSSVYNPNATKISFGCIRGNGVKKLNTPRSIGIHSDFALPKLKDLDSHSYILKPSDNDAYDILVYASHNDRYSRCIRKAISSAIPIIGYKSIPLIGELIEEGLAFELDESDDFESTITNTINYISYNPQWQLLNSMGLFKYARTVMNWDQWIYELEHL